jgi:hypothetical protein
MDMNKCDKSEDAVVKLSIFANFKYKAKCRNGDKVIAGNYRRKSTEHGKRRGGYHWWHWWGESKLETMTNLSGWAIIDEVVRTDTVCWCALMPLKCLMLTIQFSQNLQRGIVEMAVDARKESKVQDSVLSGGGQEMQKEEQEGWGRSEWKGVNKQQKYNY